MIAPSPLRYFLTLGLHAGYGLAILAAVVLVGLWTVALNPITGLDDSIGMLLFVQMFLASSGFLERARRGYFDPVLLHGSPRAVTIATHFAVSILPGAAGWLVLALCALLRGSPAAESAIWGPRLGAFFIVSAVAWAGGFTLARGAVGFLWTGGLVALLLRRADLMASGSPLAVLLCPFILMNPGAVDRAAFVAAVALAALPLLAVWRHARRLDVYLLERA